MALRDGDVWEEKIALTLDTPIVTTSRVSEPSKFTSLGFEPLLCRETNRSVQCPLTISFRGGGNATRHDYEFRISAFSSRTVAFHRPRHCGRRCGCFRFGVRPYPASTDSPDRLGRLNRQDPRGDLRRLFEHRPSHLSNLHRDDVCERERWRDVDPNPAPVPGSLL